MEKPKYIYIIASLTGIVVLIILILFLVFYFQSYDTISVGPKLLINHDGGADDAMAIFMALLYERYFDGPKVVALTTTHGNVDESQAFNNTQRILSIIGRRDVPIYRGSKFSIIKSLPFDHYFGYDGLGDSDKYNDHEPIKAQTENAAFALIELSKRYEGELVILAIGALTNIALAIRLDPGFIGRLAQLYVAAGHVSSEKYQEPEFNAAMDVEAYSIILANSSPQKVTVIAFSQVYISHNISRDWRQHVLGSIPTKNMKAQNVFEQVSLVRSNDWTLLDPVAMAIVLNETSMIEETKNSFNSIDLCEQRGITTDNFEANETNARIVYKIREEPYKKLLLDIFSAELN